MWNEINREEELYDFLNNIAFFHDSCLVNFSYISGAYVDSKLSMYPRNDKRLFRMFFQTQSSDIRTFELELYELKYLIFYPTDLQFSCEIKYAEMYIKNGFVYLNFPSQWKSEENGKIIMNSICATRCRWRIIN